MLRCKYLLIVLSMLISSVPGAASAGLVATYNFNGTLAANQAGVASLTPVDPLGQNGFVTDTVFGHSQTVYSFSGNATPPSDQAGLSLDTTGLVNSNSYAVEMVFKLFDGDSLWRRILDVQGRSSDDGFYVDPSNHLDVYPVAGSTTTFTNGVYHDVVLTVAPDNTVTASLDGHVEFTTTTSVMNINNAGNLLNFFLDNNQGPFQDEYSTGHVALINVFNSPSVATPVPSTLVMACILLGTYGMVHIWRRGNRAAIGA